MTRYELTIPKTPPSPNLYVRAHWSKYQGIKRDWQWLMLAAVSAVQKPHEPLEKACVTIVRFGKRRMDRDNLYASMKPVVDALRGSGMVKDDSDKHMELTVREGERPAGLDPFIMIEIVDTSSADLKRLQGED